MLKLFKDGDSMAVMTDCKTEDEFSSQFIETLSSLIDEGAYLGDWEFQLRYWLPQYVDLVCAYRGYKTVDVEKKLVMITGSRLLSDNCIVAEKSDISAEVILKEARLMPPQHEDAIGDAIIIVLDEYRTADGKIPVKQFQERVLEQSAVGVDTPYYRSQINKLFLRFNLGYSSISKDGKFFLSEEMEETNKELGE